MVRFLYIDLACLLISKLHLAKILYIFISLLSLCIFKVVERIFFRVESDDDIKFFSIFRWYLESKFIPANNSMWQQQILNSRNALTVLWFITWLWSFLVKTTDIIKMKNQLIKKLTMFCKPSFTLIEDISVWIF